MDTLHELADEPDPTEGGLLQAVAPSSIGAVHPKRRATGPAPDERGHAGVRGSLLSALREALANEHGVRLAVLYGSLARGDADGSSDLDLLVHMTDGDSANRSRLTAELQRVSGRRVDLAHLARVETRAPLLLDRILDEGRVLVDRDGQWDELSAHRRAIRARARRAYRREMAAAARAIEALVS